MASQVAKIFWFYRCWLWTQFNRRSSATCCGTTGCLKLLSSCHHRTLTSFPLLGVHNIIVSHPSVVLVFTILKSRTNTHNRNARYTNVGASLDGYFPPTEKPHATAQQSSRSTCKVIQRVSFRYKYMQLYGNGFCLDTVNGVEWLGKFLGKHLNIGTSCSISMQMWLYNNYTHFTDSYLAVICRVV